MIPNGPQNDPKNQKPYVLRDDRALDSHLANVMHLVEKLESKTHQLPIVDENGESECSFAEQLFAQKEEAAAKVREEVRTLEDLREFMDKEVSRLRRNLLTIDRDISRLETPEAQEGYREAQRVARDEYERATIQRKAILEVLQRAMSACREAASRKYPGKEPEMGVPAPKGPGPFPPGTFEPRIEVGLPPAPPPPIPPPVLPDAPKHPPNGPPPLTPRPGTPGGPRLY